MRPHDGLLAVALLLIAIAAGCDKSDKSESRQTEAPVTRVQERAAPATPAATAPAETTTPEPEAAESAPRPEQPATAELTRARQELEDLAEGALSLRAALLGAEFKNVQAARAGAEEDPDSAEPDQAPEVDDDSR